MKNSWNLAALLLTLIALSFAPALNAQEVEADSTGLPGDHFSLEGALELFKKAESPEAFEKLLNDADNYVNNLDLNEDGEVDYIRVEDRMEGDVHAIVLQVPVSESESQDVAVIEIEKTGAEEAILQILGDEDVFGETRIVEIGPQTICYVPPYWIHRSVNTGDEDLVQVLARQLETRFEKIMVNTQVLGMEEVAEGIRVRFRSPQGDPFEQVFDRILISVGRKPNSAGLGLETLGVAVDNKG